MQPLLNIVKWYTVQRIGGGMIKEDPYASMEKDQLISMIHFLVKREDEPTNEARVEPNSFGLYLARRRKSITQRAQENQELKDMVKDLRDTHKQKVNDLLSQISVGNNVRFGSTGQKDTRLRDD